MGLLAQEVAGEQLRECLGEAVWACECSKAGLKEDFVSGWLEFN